MTPRRERLHMALTLISDGLAIVAIVAAAAIGLYLLGVIS